MNIQNVNLHIRRICSSRHHIRKNIIYVGFIQEANCVVFWSFLDHFWRHILDDFWIIFCIIFWLFFGPLFGLDLPKLLTQILMRFCVQWNVIVEIIFDVVFGVSFGVFFGVSFGVVFGHKKYQKNDAVWSPFLSGWKSPKT